VGALYPEDPGFVPGSDTSEAAAASIDAASMRDHAWRLLRRRGDDGLTSDELEIITGWLHQSASARLRELVLLGHAYDSSIRRPTRSGRMAVVRIALRPVTFMFATQLIHPPTNPTAKEAIVPGFWDDPDIKKAAEGGAYAKFNDVGDTVSGAITKMDKKDFDGRTAIEMEFDDGTKVTFGQVLMLRDLYVLQPVPGEQLTVTLAKVEKRGAKTLKLFRVELVRLDGQVEKIDQTEN
jgi:hypothetical protein